jgi:thioredoxin 1
MSLFYRSFTRFATAAVLLGSAVMAHALDVKPYSAEALAAAQKVQHPVALHFHADWCPTCRAQSKVLEELQTEPNLDVTVLTVDYDHEKALKRQLGVRSQSTFIVYKGTKETARSTGETQRDGVRALLKSAL